MYGYVTPDGGFAIGLWFRRTVLTGQFECLLSQFTQAQVAWATAPTINGRHFWLGFKDTDGALYLDAYKEDGTRVVYWSDPSPSTYVNDSAWHFVAVRMATNKTTFTVRLDGETLATISASAAVDWRPGMLSIGGTAAPHLGLYGADLYTAGLAMVSLCNHEISDNRLLEWYTAGSGGTVYYGDNEVQRLNRIYDWTDTPIMCRDSDAALSTLQGLQVAGTNALDALLETAKAANGYAFADGQTWIQYHNKRHRYNRFNLWTFAESTGSAVEAGIDFSTDEERIWNDVRGKRPYGGSYRMRDSVSVDEYGRRTYEFSLPITSSEELRNTVGWLLARYGTKHLRVAGVSVSADTSSVIEQATAGRIEVGDHVVLDELPDWAPVDRIECTVEGISLDADFENRSWRMSFNLTPAEFDRVFQVGVSELGSTDKVAL